MTVERQCREEDLTDRLDRVTVGTPLWDILREIQYSAKEVEYYRNLYEDMVPREHRSPSYTVVVSTRSRHSHSRTESRGVMGPT